MIFNSASPPLWCDCFDWVQVVIGILSYIWYRKIENSAFQCGWLLFLRYKERVLLHLVNSLLFSVPVLLANGVSYVYTLFMMFYLCERYFLRHKLPLVYHTITFCLMVSMINLKIKPIRISSHHINCYSWKGCWQFISHPTYCTV